MLAQDPVPFIIETACMGVFEIAFVLAFGWSLWCERRDRLRKLDVERTYGVTLAVPNAGAPTPANGAGAAASVRSPVGGATTMYSFGAGSTGGAATTTAAGRLARTGTQRTIIASPVKDERDFLWYCRRCGLVAGLASLVWSIDLHGSLGVLPEIMTTLLSMTAFTAYLVICSFWIYFHASVVYKQLKTPIPVHLTRLLYILPPLFYIPGFVLTVLATALDSNLFQSVYSLLFGSILTAYCTIISYVCVNLRAQLNRFVQQTERRSSVAAAGTDGGPASPNASGAQRASAFAMDTSHIKSALKVVLVFAVTTLPVGFVMAGILLSAGIFGFASGRAFTDPVIAPPSVFIDAVPYLVIDICGWIAQGVIVWYCWPKASAGAGGVNRESTIAATTTINVAAASPHGAGGGTKRGSVTRPPPILAGSGAKETGDMKTVPVVSPANRASVHGIQPLTKRMSGSLGMSAGSKSSWISPRQVQVAGSGAAAAAAATVASTPTAAAAAAAASAAGNANGAPLRSSQAHGKPPLAPTISTAAASAIVDPPAEPLSAPSAKDGPIQRYNTASGLVSTSVSGADGSSASPAVLSATPSPKPTVPLLLPPPAAPASASAATLHPSTIGLATPDIVMEGTTPQAPIRRHANSIDTPATATAGNGGSGSIESIWGAALTRPSANSLSSNGTRVPTPPAAAAASATVPLLNTAATSSTPTAGGFNPMLSPKLTRSNF